MNRAVLSLCLFGTALATANTLITQRPSCPSGGANIVAAYAETSPGTVAAVPSAPAQAAKPKPAQAPKDQAASPVQAKPAKTEDAKPAAPKDLDQTGSVNQATQKQKPAPVPQTELGDQQVKVGGEEQWAEVVLAARAHSAASVSSPTIRHYRVGTRLKVIDRKSGWIKVVDPTTSNPGWIFEKYLMLKEGSDKKQVEGPGSQRTAQSESDDPNLVAPAQPGPYARPYTRKQGWRRAYRYVWPPAGLAIRVYPGW
jgi:hypothetical protein